MYTLAPMTPPDKFDEVTGVLRCPNSRTITVQTFNQAVYYQLIIGRDNGSLISDAWEPVGDGAYLAPGIWTFDSDDFGGAGGVGHAIRFRVADIGQSLPAVVSVHA